ncbi:MAG: protein kinase domain-containing protein [Actinomycetota bacterium]
MDNVKNRIIADRYRLDGLIARGGMGVVYRGEDTRLERPVAVKLLGDGFVEEALAVERFKREARAAARLNHPNIANVYDYGIADGSHYIVMELLPGPSLAEQLRTGPLDPDTAARIALQIAEALEVAHANGLIHRDIKPANVVFCAEDRIKVTDFGIAKLDDQTRLTSTGGLFGTPQYVSPEQMAGQPATVRSDVYSLGVVLFEMLTGTPPFSGDNAVAVAMKHLSEDIPRPSTRSSGIPPELDAVVERATARDPNDRYRDASGMAAALLETLNETAPLTPSRTVPLDRTVELQEEADADLFGSLRSDLDAFPTRVAAIGLAVLLALVVLISLGGDSPLPEKVDRPQGRPAGIEEAFDRLEEAVKP